MGKITHTLLLAAFAALITAMAACSGGKFKIKGDLKNADGQNLHIAYYTPNGVTDSWVTLKDGKFEFHGSSDELTLAAIYDTDSRLVACVAVKNGNTVTLSGDLTDTYHITASGTDENERWSEFIGKHAQQLTEGDTKAVNADIEKYVKAHPDDVTSTLLVIVNYNSADDPAKAQRLLSSIKPDARPQSLVGSFDALTLAVGKGSKQLAAMLLMNANADAYSQLRFSDASYTLLCIWGGENEGDHRTYIGQLKSLASQAGSGRRLQIADVSLEPDSSFWRSEVVRDSANWQHYWAPEGPVNGDLKQLCITSTPLFVLADSTGRVIARGNAVAAILGTARQRLGI